MSDQKIQIIVDEDLEDLIPGFLENRMKDIDNIRAAITEADFESLRSIGHSLKGVGGGFGFEKITEIGAEIESCAKKSDLETIRNLAQQLEDYMGNLEIKYQEMP